MSTGLRPPGREHDAGGDAGDREQRAVRKVEDPGDAVDQRQSKGDQRVEAAEQDAADQQLDDDGGHVSPDRALRGPNDAQRHEGDGQASFPVA